MRIIKQQKKDILDRIKISTQDQVKENMRKRKLYLIRKKQGLVDNIEHDNFLNKVNDKCNNMLNIINIYRYLFSFNQNAKLETILSIFKKGVMSCSIKKDKKT